MFSDPVALTLALLLCFAAVAILAYEAGADAQKRADWEKHSADALALVAETTSLAPGWVDGWPDSSPWVDDSGSRGRHPSR